MRTEAAAAPPRAKPSEDDDDPGLACTLFTAKFLLLVGGCFFSLFALANSIFLIPAFFVFLLLGCTCRTVVSTFARHSSESSGALAFGAVTGVVIIVALSVAGIVGVRFARHFISEKSETAKYAFDGAWQIYGAIIYTYLAVCVLQLADLGSRMAPRSKATAEEILAESAGDEQARRNGFFHAALGSVLKDCVRTFMFLLALGGWGDLVALPVPAGVGFLAGLLCAGALVAPVLDEEAEAAAAAAAAGPGARTGATAALGRAASRHGGVISEREQARVIANAWEGRRARIVDALPPEHRQQVAAIVGSLSFSETGKRADRAPVAAVDELAATHRRLRSGNYQVGNGYDEEDPSAPVSPATDDDVDQEEIVTWEAIVAGAQARANEHVVAPPAARTPVVASDVPQQRNSMRTVVAPTQEAATAAAAKKEKNGDGGFGCIGRLALAFSALMVLLVAAGMAATALPLLQDAGAFSENAASKIMWDTCDNTSGEGNSAKDVFFKVLVEQFGWECAPTALYVYSWCGYWAFAAIFCTLTLKVGLCGKRSPGPVRRRRPRCAAAVGAPGPLWPARGLPDPSRIRYHKTAVFIRALAVVNIALGCLYLWWRVTESMKGVKYPIWSWVFFAGECILMWGVFSSHGMRIFPAERDRCTMDELVAIDKELGAEATVAVLLPTAGEKLPALKHAILGAYSQRLWESALEPNRQLRLCVLDEKRRPEVLALVDIVYQLAIALSDPSVQRELSAKLDEAWVSPKIWMDTFEQFGALDRYIFGRECAQVFELSVALEEMVSSAGGSHFRHRLQRASSGSLKPGEQPGQRPATGTQSTNTTRPREQRPAPAATVAAAGPAPALEPGCKRLFSSCARIPSLVYYARKDSGMPRASPKAGNMNAAIFPAELGAEAVVGAARIVMVNDARHRIKGECLQRTVPYFFRLGAIAAPAPPARVTAAAPAGTTAATPASRARAQPRYLWANVAFVQLPQRFEDLGDGDPLANHAAMTFFVANVAKDGIGGVTSCGQGGLWRVDALAGYDVGGKRTIADPVVNRRLIGHSCGFRAEVLIEDTHTSLSLFRLGWRSAYVCEAGEALAICVDPPNTVEWRVKQVFRWHLGAVQLLLRDGLSFVFAWRMPTPLHRLIALDCITYFLQSIGGMILLIMPVIFAALQEPPFQIRSLMFVYFFVPYLLTASLPTMLSISWKGVHPDSILTDEQFWMATCYVQFWALVMGLKDAIFCSDPKNAWSKKCPTFPLPLAFVALTGAAAYTTAAWVMRGFSDPFTWFASLGTCIVMMHAIWPMFLRWMPRFSPKGPAMPSAYLRKLMLVVLFVAICGLLVVFAVK